MNLNLIWSMHEIKNEASLQNQIDLVTVGIILKRL